MDHAVHGKVILKEIPSEASKARIVDLLARHAKSASREKISALLDKTPLHHQQGHLPDIR
jgi:hypothetical protein